MRFRRILSLAVCLLFVLTFIAGCGKTVSDQNSDQNPAPSSQPTPAEPVKLVFVRPIWGDLRPDTEPFQRIIKKIKEKINVEIELVGQLNPSTAGEKVNLMIAAGEHFDLFSIEPQSPSGALEVNRLVKQDIITPLDDLLKTDGQDLLNAVEPQNWKYYTVNGKIYGIPSEWPKNISSLCYRKDWLDKYNLTVPTTIEEYENVLKVFKEKENDPGYTPVWPDAVEYMFVGSFIPSGEANFMDTDGKIKPVHMHKDFKAFLAKMQEWYLKGYIHKEFATLKMDQASNLITSGKVGLTHAWSDPAGLFNVEGKKVDPNYNMVYGPALNGLIEGTFTAGITVGGPVCITKACKNPEAAMKYINYTSATIEGFELGILGEDGIDFIATKREGDYVFYKDNADLPKEKKVGQWNFYTATLNKFQYNLLTGDAPTDWLKIVPNYKLGESVDLGLFYDTGAMKSKDKKADLDTMLKEAKYTIIMGLKPVDYWDEVVKDWIDKGGSMYIDDMTEQYNAWKAQQK